MDESRNDVSLSVADVIDEHRQNTAGDAFDRDESIEGSHDVFESAQEIHEELGSNDACIENGTEEEFEGH